ncbi:RNase H domain-containing protein [Trichonephila clavipes]|nr:RNase H domain-containing protein [Trichonephila clavipes]
MDCVLAAKPFADMASPQEYITQPQIQANIFADFFASKNAYHEPIPLDFFHKEDNNLNKPFHIFEIHRAIKLSKNSTPGADHITASFLKNLDRNGCEIILRYFQDLFDNAIVPNSWKHAVILPIPKQCKDKTRISSYRPIALTSIFSKTFERVLTNRLSYFLTTERKLHPQHYGFVPFKDSRSATYLIHKAIMDAKLKKKYFVGDKSLPVQIIRGLFDETVNRNFQGDFYIIATDASKNEQITSIAATRGLLATDHVILNHGQVTWTTPELWTPGHSNILWNEQADNLARTVTESNVYIDWISSEDINKKIYQESFKKANDNFYSSKYFVNLGNIPNISTISKWTRNRREEILCTRIFSKMIITPGLLHKFNLSDNANCRSCNCLNDLDHILLNCNRYIHPRNHLKHFLKIDPHHNLTFKELLEKAMSNRLTFRFFIQKLKYFDIY